MRRRTFGIVMVYGLLVLAAFVFTGLRYGIGVLLAVGVVFCIVSILLSFGVLDDTEQYRKQLLHAAEEVGYATATVTPLITLGSARERWALEDQLKATLRERLVQDERDLADRALTNALRALAPSTPGPCDE